MQPLSENKTTPSLIYIRHRDKVGGGEMGQEKIKININDESLDPTILDLILDALSYGVARSIINSAVESISPIDVTQQVNENLVDSLTK
jgi:hypothetical protein